MARLVLRNNFLSFQGQYYLQIDGVATGSPLAPVVANLYMNDLESAPCQKWKEQLQYYKRYVDDVFAIWKGTESELQQFQSEMDGLHRNIKFTWTSRRDKAEFLDLVIYKRKNKLEYRIHQKALNRYLYIPFNSYHPEATKKALIQGELKRYYDRCSQRQDFKDVMQLFYARLRARGYHHKWLLRQFKIFVDQPRQERIEQDRSKGDGTLLPFIVPFNPSTERLRWKMLLNPKPLVAVCPKDSLKKMIGEARYVTAWCRGRNLLQILRSKLDFWPRPKRDWPNKDRSEDPKCPRLSRKRQREEAEN
jgi:hypothetical protein